MKAISIGSALFGLICGVVLTATVGWVGLPVVALNSIALTWILDN